MFFHTKIDMFTTQLHLSEHLVYQYYSILPICIYILNFFYTGKTPQNLMIKTQLVGRPSYPINWFIPQVAYPIYETRSQLSFMEHTKRNDLPLATICPCYLFIFAESWCLNRYLWYLNPLFSSLTPHDPLSETPAGIIFNFYACHLESSSRTNM